ncbi:peroxiredoxin family protein [Chloroflexota bacterium]
MQKLLDKHWTITSILILALGAGWIWMSAVPQGSTTPGGIPAPQEEFLAPDFKLNTLDGDSITLSDLRGKAVLVNFWATWCPPCRSEMPAMQQVFDDYGPDELVILAVNSSYQDQSDDVDTFVFERGLTFPVLLDTTGEISDQYQVNSLPTTFFIDPEGIIKEIVIGGPMSEALLRTRVDRLLREQN